MCDMSKWLTIIYCIIVSQKYSFYSKSITSNYKSSYILNNNTNISNNDETILFIVTLIRQIIFFLN